MPPCFPTSSIASLQAGGTSPPRPRCRSYTVIRTFQDPETGQGRYDLLADSDPLATAAGSEELLFFLWKETCSFTSRSTPLPGSSCTPGRPPGGAADPPSGQQLRRQKHAGRRTALAGATYYSDEYAVLDEDARVHPYPRRLSLRARRAKLAAGACRSISGAWREPAQPGSPLIGLFAYRPQPTHGIVRALPRQGPLELTPA